MVPIEVLDKLIAAGLGDIPQYRIQPHEFERAMRGEVVRVQKPRPHSLERCACGACGACKARARYRRYHHRKKARLLQGSVR